MRYAPLLALLAVATACGQDRALVAIAGKYAVTEMARDGKPVPDAVRKGVSGVTVAGEKITITMNGKELVAKLRADVTTSPMQLDLYPEGDEFDPGRKFPGIYKSDGKTLTITFVEDGDRPTDFATQAKTATKLVLEKK